MGYAYRDGLYRASENIFYAGNNSNTPDSTRIFVQETDENGNEDMLTTINEDGKETHYEYNAELQLTKETDPNGNTVSYQYDNQDNISAIVVKDNKGKLIGETNYQYDAEGKIKAIKDADNKQISSYQYDTDDNLVQKSLSNGSKISYEYNDAGWMSEVKAEDKKGAVVEEISYAYDVNGNVIMQEDVEDNLQVEYEYDGLSRLVNEDWAGKKNRSVNYTYDEAGNCISISDGEAVVSTYDDANRLVEAAGNEVDYDNNGNMVSNTGTEYTCDAGQSDSCNKVFYSGLAVNKGLGFNKLLKYNNDPDEE